MSAVITKKVGLRSFISSAFNEFGHTLIFFTSGNIKVSASSCSKVSEKIPGNGQSGTPFVLGVVDYQISFAPLSKRPLQADLEKGCPHYQLATIVVLSIALGPLFQNEYSSEALKHVPGYFGEPEYERLPRPSSANIWKTLQPEKDSYQGLQNPLIQLKAPKQPRKRNFFIPYPTLISAFPNRWPG